MEDEQAMIKPGEVSADIIKAAEVTLTNMTFELNRLNAY